MKFKEIKKLYSRIHKKTSGDLSVIITQRNEGYEIEKTINSIRATAKYNIPIILIDDHSDDSFDYKNMCKKLRLGE